MFTIVKKTELSDLVILFEIEAPQIAKKAKAGNFFVVKIHEQGLQTAQSPGTFV